MLAKTQEPHVDTWTKIVAWLDLTAGERALLEQLARVGRLERVPREAVRRLERRQAVSVHRERGHIVLCSITTLGRRLLRTRYGGRLCPACGGHVTWFEDDPDDPELSVRIECPYCVDGLWYEDDDPPMTRERAAEIEAALRDEEELLELRFREAHLARLEDDYPPYI